VAREVKLSTRKNLPELKMNVSSFKKGLITLTDESLLPIDAATESKNLYQKMDGRWTPRWGTAYYGATTGATLSGAGVYTASNGTSNYLVVASGTNIKYSTNNGATWTTCTGATITAGKKCYFIQIGAFLYIANGTDNLIRFNGTSTLQVYSQLSAPSTPTVTKTGLGSTTYTASYRIAAVNEVGETPGSTAATVGISKTRDNWTAGTDFITVTWPKVTNAVGYNIYYLDDTNGGTEHRYIASVNQPSGGTVSFTDTGEASIPMNNFVVVPTGNTTTGPTFSQMELSGNRIWATLDPNNPYRVYWSGAGPNIGAFSEFSGGGYIDLEKGGRERPTAVVHYRDGKGGAYATVFTSDLEGNGSTWQISLEAVSIGNISFALPVAIKIVGSIGSDAPLSVVKVRNDIQFFNRRGWYSLRSKAQMLNLLSTDEISANIRPDIEQMTGTALDGVCAYYYQSKVFCSMPYGSTANNRIYINDTERYNWSGPWTFGVERFFEYADSNGNNHLLAVPVNGERLIEIADNIEGDLGVAFETKYVSGLYPIDADRNAFAKIRYVYFEFNNPVGDIQVSILGTEKKRGFSNLKTVTISDTVSNAGYGTQKFSSAQFSDTSIEPNTFAQASVKKRIRVNKLLNNIQFVVTTNQSKSDYTLLNIQAKGFIIPTGDPQRWKSLT
jgi:hypothetical protein